MRILEFSPWGTGSLHDRLRLYRIINFIKEIIVLDDEQLVSSAGISSKGASASPKSGLALHVSPEVGGAVQSPTASDSHSFFRLSPTYPCIQTPNNIFKTQNALALAQERTRRTVIHQQDMRKRQEEHTMWRLLLGLFAPALALYRYAPLFRTNNLSARLTWNSGKSFNQPNQSTVSRSRSTHKRSIHNPSRFSRFADDWSNREFY